MRKHDRLEIESPVTVGLRVMTNGGGIEFGQLRDIGERGARFQLERPLSVNTPVNLLVHFRDPYEQVVTLGFDAVVTRAAQEPPYEIAVRFRSGPRYFRGDLADMLKRRARRLGADLGNDALPFKRGKEKAENPFLAKGPLD